jgi:hypothetical protein
MSWEILPGRYSSQSYQWCKFLNHYFYRHFMESSILLSISACIGFAVYYEMVGVTYLEHTSSNGAFVSSLFFMMTTDVMKAY